MKNKTFEQKKQSGFKKFDDKLRELIEKHFPEKNKEKYRVQLLYLELIVWIKNQLKLNQ